MLQTLLGDAASTASLLSTVRGSAQLGLRKRRRFGEKLGEFISIKHLFGSGSRKYESGAPSGSRSMKVYTAPSRRVERVACFFFPCSSSNGAILVFRNNPELSEPLLGPRKRRAGKWNVELDGLL